MFRSTVLLIVPALFGSTLGAKSAGKREARPSFEVRIQNYANLPHSVLWMAVGTAGRVFRKAGVEIKWIDCTPGKKADEACRADLEPNSRVLRVLPPTMAARSVQSGIELGRALLSEDASRGTYASVYWGRVQALAAGETGVVSHSNGAQSARLRQGRILGYALAHELGHLFGVHHSKSGVMSGPWSPSELAELLRGTLRFQRAEEGRIRLSLANRGSNTIPTT